MRGQGQCYVEEAQTLSIRILNCTQRTMELALSFDTNFSKKEQFLWIGLVSKQLGKLEAHHTYDIELQLVPLTCGLKVIQKFILPENKIYNLFFYIFSVLVV